MCMHRYTEFLHLYACMIFLLSIYDFNTLTTAQNIRYYAHDIFKWIILRTYVCMLIMISLDLIPPRKDAIDDQLSFMRHSLSGTNDNHVHWPIHVPYGLRELTHWGRDNVAAIFRTTWLNAFTWIKIYEFGLRFHWSFFLRVQLTIFQHWCR